MYFAASASNQSEDCKTSMSPSPQSLAEEGRAQQPSVGNSALFGSGGVERVPNPEASRQVPEVTHDSDVLFTIWKWNVAKPQEELARLSRLVDFHKQCYGDSSCLI